MFNQFVYNTQMYNAPNNLIVPGDQDPIVFNGYSLQNAEIVSHTLVQDNTPDRSLEINDIPRNDGQFIIGDYWRSKRIIVKGEIKKPTRELLEAEVDKMKKALAVREAFLDIKIPSNGNVIRRYKATLNNGNNMFSGRQHYHVTFLPFEVEFLSVEPFGHSVNYDHFTLFGINDLILNEQIDNVGTIRAKPVVILNFSEADNVTAISFKNNTRGEEIELVKNISAGDYVRFDSESLEVTVNSVVQDYNGSFPLLNTDSNSVTIKITGNSAKYTYTSKYLIPYL